MIKGFLTRHEDVLVWGSDKLHCLLCEDCHVFVDGTFGDILVCGVI